MNEIFETHAHYDDEAFDEDRDLILQSLQDKGVCGVVTAGADLKSSLKAIELSQKYEYIYAAVGVHTENVSENLDENYLEKLSTLISENQKVVAVGEIGLDYHFRTDNKELQKEVFINQIKLANKLGLPVLVHDREAHADTMEILKNLRPRGIVHCFSGSLENRSFNASSVICKVLPLLLL